MPTWNVKVPDWWCDDVIPFEGRDMKEAAERAVEDGDSDDCQIASNESAVDVFVSDGANWHRFRVTGWYRRTYSAAPIANMPKWGRE